MLLKNKKQWAKSEMSRTIVIYCLRLLSLTLLWAACLKTCAIIRWGEAIGCDLSDVLIYAGGAFGIELISLAFKRIYAGKNNKGGDDIDGQY